MRDFDALVRHFAMTGGAAFAAKRAVDMAFRDGLRDRDPEAYSRLLEEFFVRLAAAQPTGSPDLLEDLRGAKPRAVDAATAFLHADPYFFRSGYLKAQLIRRLKRAKLTPKQKLRLQAIVLARVNGPDRNEFSAYCRLALAVRSPELEEELERRMDSPDPGVARRALWMLMRFESVPETPARQ